MNITNTSAVINDFTGFVSDNTLNDYFIALGAFIAVIFLLKFFEAYLIHRIQKLTKKTETNIDDMLIEFIAQVDWPFNATFSLFVVSWFLTLPTILDKAIMYLFVLVVLFYVVRGIFKVIDFLTSDMIKDKKSKKERGGTHFIRALGTIGKVFLVLIVLLLALSNFGVNISSLLAGIGIGGIAIAFALQNILRDLFSSFTLFFDKPFVEGDFIAVGQDFGTVRRMGLKSTRIETLQGQELIISNNELTNARVDNYHHMKEWRVPFTIGVVYNTPVKKLEKIPGIIKEIIDNTEKARFEWAHFKEYGDFSLVYEIVYFTETPDYYEYMKKREKINLDIARAFEKHKITFAYPTQTVYLHQT